MITVLSLGAGVQSSTLALMAAQGEVTPMPDVAVFADTGYEPKAVYDWLDWLEKELPYPVEKVTRGNLRDDKIKTKVRAKTREAALPSACLCCPFNSEAEWLDIKNGDPEEWKDVVEFDNAIRKLGGDRGDLFLHRSCQPLEEVDFFTLENAGQMSLLDECEGMCGV